jgi:hypothetical protein
LHFGSFSLVQPSLEHPLLHCCLFPPRALFCCLCFCRLTGWAVLPTRTAACAISWARSVGRRSPFLARPVGRDPDWLRDQWSPSRQQWRNLARFRCCCFFSHCIAARLWVSCLSQVLRHGSQCLPVGCFLVCMVRACPVALFCCLWLPSQPGGLFCPPGLRHCATIQLVWLHG